MIVSRTLNKEKNGVIDAYEFKWKSSTAKVPKKFTETYNAAFKVINKENYFEFVLLRR